MVIYADLDFYTNEYRKNMCGNTAIADSDFPHYALKATKEIRARTFGNIREDDILDEVMMCCCEIAEKLFNLDRARGENGMVLQSYSNDGDSGTFQTADMTQAGISAGIDQIVRSWLLDTGMLFCGRRKMV